MRVGARRNEESTPHPGPLPDRGGEGERDGDSRFKSAFLCVSTFLCAFCAFLRLFLPAVFLCLLCFRFFGFTFPHDEGAPAELAQGALMELIAGGVAVELGEPPVASGRGRRAVLATGMPMPETPVNEHCETVLRQNEIGADGL